MEQPVIKVRRSKAFKISMIILGVLTSLVIAFFVYLNIHYDAEDDDYLKSTANVQVSIMEDYIFFDGAGEDKAFIFYPGAKVDSKAYAPIMFMLADKGVDCFIMNMPYNMALFDINKADQIIDRNDYDEYYLGGHSLGGAMSSVYAEKNSDKLKGMIFFASYADRDLSKTSLKAILIYGDKDGVLNMDNIESRRNMLPEGYEEHIIKGGNHAQFGNYGVQKGDNAATISKENQWNETVQVILDFVGGN